jgi:chromosomal replication initiation ATPase DnaA
LERCDFASVTTILRNDLLEGNFENQMDFAESLFASYLEENETYFDMGLLNKWLNGLARLSPAVGRFYLGNDNHKKALTQTLEDVILPCLSDSAMTVQKVYELLIGDSSISERKKQELYQHYPCQNIAQEADFLAEVLIFGMNRPFVKRDVRKPNLLTSGALSPVLRDFVLDEGVPKPCRWFCGRERELVQLHEELVRHGKVFLHGIAGIGKSELAKAYAKEHKADYTNILYLTYSGSLQRDITDLDFADDLPEDSEAERFRKHNRFLRTLKEDTLLIVDNFDTTSARDEFLSVILKYRCRILFTTRSQLPGQVSFLLEEITNPEELFQLAAHFDSRAEHHRPILEQIIQTVHCHTLAVELVARLLETGILEPQEVLSKLREEKADFDAADKIGMSKDGKNRKATYYDHIHTLFALFRLSQPEQDILRSLTLTPARGIPARLFGKWMNFYDLNAVNDLVELGFIQAKPGNRIALHPMMREVALSDVPPSILKCHPMLESIRATCQLHGQDVSYYPIMFQTVENAIELAQKDDMAFYLRLLEDVFQYMETYHYENGLRLLTAEMDKLLGDPSIGTTSDRAVLLDCHARLEQKPEKAVKRLKDALALFPEVNADNALLVSNLNANLGGLYRTVGKNGLAKQHMEAAASILDEYGLIGYHDSIPQLVNYAVLLSDMGQPEQGLAGLQKLAHILQENTSDQTMDYAQVQETMGSLCLILGNIQQATAHFKKALAVYEVLFAADPERVEAKKQEWRETQAELCLRRKLRQ